MKIGNVFVTNRQLSAQEAAYKMCNLPLRSSNVNVIFIDIKPSNFRCKLM